MERIFNKKVNTVVKKLNASITGLKLTVPEISDSLFKLLFFAISNQNVFLCFSCCFHSEEYGICQDDRL